MWDILSYLFWFIVIAGLVVAAGYLARAYLNGVSPVAMLFAARPQPRLGVVEQSSVDGRRRLVLIRRDNVEHLIMTGGPVDVVIETGISLSQTVLPGTQDVTEPTFSRATPSFDQALVEH